MVFNFFHIKFNISFTFFLKIRFAANIQQKSVELKRIAKLDLIVDVFLIAHATRKVFMFAEINEYDADKK